MCRTVFAPVVLLALLILSVSRGQSCPRSCNCYQANEVHCTFRSLLNIPAGLPAHTRRINLGFNIIRKLYDGSLAGLRRVELLMLHSNDLHHIPDSVFRDMKSLQILKLSYNKLKEIPSSLTFSGLTSLLRLYLDHNHLQYIHPRALLQLPSLRLLRLQGNRLHQLHPHTLCTLSLLDTFHFSTLRHLDLSNNSLSILLKDTLTTAPLLETLSLHNNPWSCDCRMNWFLKWSVAHPGLMKCPHGPQCPVCASPTSLKGQGLFDQKVLLCSSPIIQYQGKEVLLETDLAEIQSSAAFREPFGNVSMDLSDHHGNIVDLSCNITHSPDSSDIIPSKILSSTSTSPLPLALSLSLECPIVGQSYAKLWRILAYYSETVARLKREIMISKVPALAYRYRQAPEADGYYYTGVKVSVKAEPAWLLQPDISIQLNRAQSNGEKVFLIYSTIVPARPRQASNISLSSSTSNQWVMISRNGTITALTAVSGRNTEISCPLLSFGEPTIQWVLPSGSRLSYPSNILDGRLQASASSLIIQKVQPSDAGLYYCVASAGKDLDVLPLRLVVIESSAPYPTEKLGSPITGKVGKPVSLSCKVSGSPDPFMSWILPDGKVVWQGLAVPGSLKVQSNGSLTLLKATVKDAGYYRCIAANQYGSDTMSLQLLLNSQHTSTMENSIFRRPQSAAGISTKLRAPQFHQDDNDGSGYEEEKQELKPSNVSRRYQVTSKLDLDGRHSIVKFKKRGRLRGSQVRGGGGSVSPPEQRKRFHNRHRIDPQKWADLLAKIRQKTANSNGNQIITKGNLTAGTIQEHKDEDTTEHGEHTETSGILETEVERETEGSSFDDTITNAQPQPSPPSNVHTQTITWPKTSPETERGLEISTSKYSDSAGESESNIQFNKTIQESETASHSVTQKMEVRFSPTVRNEEVLETSHVKRKIINSARTKSNTLQFRPVQKLFPKYIPQKPWNPLRKIGQQRHLGRPRNSSKSFNKSILNHVYTESQTLPPKTTVDTLTVLPSSTFRYPSIMLTSSAYFETPPNAVTRNSPMPVSTSADRHTITSSKFKLLSPTTSQASSSASTNLMTHSARELLTEESTFNNTFAPTRSNMILEMHVAAKNDRTFTNDIQTPTTTQTPSGENTDSPSSKFSKETERDILGESHFSITYPFRASPIPGGSPAVTSAPNIKITPSADHGSRTYIGSTESTSVPLHNGDTLPTNTITTIISHANSASTTNATRLFSETSISFTSPSSSSTTLSHAPTTAMFSTTTDTSTHTYRPTSHSTSTNGAANSIINTSKTFTTSFVTESTRSKASVSVTEETTSTQFLSASTREPTLGMQSSATTTMKTKSSTTATRDSQSFGQLQPRVRAIPGATNKSRSPTDWKDHGANFIPDSNRSRFPWSSSSSLSASPREPVVRSRPTISDPHIRTVSVAAESTARLACEAQGEPKPFITWTKVATGAVMSIHSRPHRFEVLPNGTLVIQNVQMLDRGTYICSANSFLGRDRLLTTLEVWTRPPRMQVGSYREVTIHPGGQVHVDCQADGVPTPLLSWVLPNRSTLTAAAPSSNRITVDTNGTLHISVILPSDRGVYRCVASNLAGAASASLLLHVSLLPPVIQQPRKEHLILSPGSPVYVHCTARGAPPPTLRWQIPNGTFVRPSQFLHGNLFVLPNGTLHIHRVALMDTGDYQCSASNAVGTSKRIVRVDVQEGTQFNYFEGVKDNKINSSFTKERTQNFPRVSSDPFTYSNDSTVFPSDSSRKLLISTSLSNASSNSSPKINRTLKAFPSRFADIRKTNPFSVFPLSNVPTDNTKVSPSVNTTRLTSSFSAESKISGASQPSLPVSPFTKALIVSTSPSASTVDFGGILRLHCSVTGNPTPIIIWRIPSRKLADMHYSFDRRLKVDHNGTLTVQEVTEKDSGDYLCIARNKVSDDYRILRVSVATKPAKIEPKQPSNHEVLVGKPLKVDCQATGLPRPVVRWSLPNGAIVNNMLFGENNGQQLQRLTVFDNGTLLVPAVGREDEGYYMCYAENRAGQDTMTVKVKVSMATPPDFADERSHYSIKVKLGETAKIPCQPRGDPIPKVTWFSPANRVIPQSLGSGHYYERVVVVSGGTLEVRSAQRIDTGNYTCQASNSAGVKRFVVRLKVEPGFTELRTQSGGGRDMIFKSNNYRDDTKITSFGSTYGSKISNNSNNGRMSNTVTNTGSSNFIFRSSNPTMKSYSQNGFMSSVHGITTKQGNNQIGGGTNMPQSLVNNEESRINAYNPNISSRIITFKQITDRGNINNINLEINNEVPTGRSADEANSSRDSSKLSAEASNHGSSSGSMLNSGFRRRNLNRDNDLGGSNNNRRHSVGSTGNSNMVLGVVPNIKRQAVKGQTVIFHCPSQGTPPPQLAWLLPGNGILPAPYYGNRVTVHQNASLELRDVQASDGGMLVCIMRSKRADVLMRVHLEVTERRDAHTGSLIQTSHPVSVLQSFQRGSAAVPQSPSFPVSVSKPSVNRKTVPPVSIVNGETLRLTCPTAQTHGSVLWTMPSGNMLSSGESGDSGGHIVLEDGTLTIKQTSVFDRGTYTCSFSSPESSSASIIMVPVIVIAYPPRITAGPAPVTYTGHGVAIELPCQTIATPRASVTWETPDLRELRVTDQPRIFGNRYLSPQGSLVIQNPSHRDTGFYRCTAKNMIGVDSKATYLRVI